MRQCKVFTEAQKAEEALILKRRVKVAMTKAYKRLPFFLDRHPEGLGINVKKWQAVDPVIGGFDDAAKLEYLIVAMAVERAKLKGGKA